MTSDERNELLKIIGEATVHDKKKLKEFAFIFLFSAFALTAFLSWKNGFSVQLLGAIFGVFLFQFLFLLFLRFLSNGGSKKLKRDLSTNTVVIGESTIKSINYFNRSVRLLDGTKVYENDSENLLWRKGDLIFYSRTLSNEHIFQSKRV